MTREEKFRKAAEAEDGQPVSAGARAAHVRAAIDAGRGLYVDLSKIPPDQRPSVAEKILSLVDEWGSQAGQPGVLAPNSGTQVIG